jgi:hypothetical protein
LISQARSAWPNESVTLKKKHRDLQTAKAICPGGAAQRDHFPRNTSVNHEQWMLRAALALRGSLKTE